MACEKKREGFERKIRVVNYFKNIKGINKRILSKVKNYSYGSIIKYIDGSLVTIRLFLGFKIRDEEIIARNSARTFANPWKNIVRFEDKTVVNSDKYGEEHVELIIKGLKLRKESRIIDAGCRNGKFLEQLDRKGFSHLIGIEIVPEWVKFAHSVGRNYVRQAEITEYEKEEDFDLVYCRHVLEHLPYPQKALAQFDSWSKPNGYIVIIFPLTKIRTNKHLAYIPNIEYFRKMISSFPWKEIVLDYSKDINLQKLFNQELLITPEDKNEITYIGRKLMN